MLRAIQLVIAITIAISTSVFPDDHLLLPDDVYPGLDGQKHSLQEWRGKVILLNFWATWCAPCQYEIRDFIRYQKEYGDRGLQIIGLGLDKERKLKNVQRTLEINYPILIAGEQINRKLLREWGNKQGMIPFTLVFDTTGRLVNAHLGVIDDDFFDEIVLPLLKTQS